MKNKRGEIATLLTLGLVIVGAVITIASSLFVGRTKNFASNPRADEGSIRYGSTNCTCGQICGEYSNYVPSSQIVDGAVRQCTCKNKDPESACATNFDDKPDIPPPDPNPTDNCVAGSYMKFGDCENVCGLGNCQSCKLNTTIKYECTTNGNLSSCVKPITYANQTNCKSVNGGDSANCTQCLRGGSVRYELDGPGPTMAPYATSTSTPIRTPTPTSPLVPPTPPVNECEQSLNLGECINDYPGWTFDSNTKMCCPRAPTSPPAAKETPIPPPGSGGVQVICDSINCPAGTTGGPYYMTTKKLSNKDYTVYYKNEEDCKSNSTDSYWGELGQYTLINKICRRINNEAVTPIPPTAEPTLDVSGGCNFYSCSNDVNIKYSTSCANPSFGVCGGSWHFYYGTEGCSGNPSFSSTSDNIQQSAISFYCENIEKNISVNITLKSSNPIKYEPTKPMAIFQICFDQSGLGGGVETICPLQKSFDLSGIVPSGYSITENFKGTENNLKFYLIYNPFGWGWRDTLSGSLKVKDGTISGDVYIN